MNLWRGLALFTALSVIGIGSVQATILTDQNNPTAATDFCYITNNCGQSFVQAHDNIAGAGIFVDPNYSTGSGTITMSVYDSYGPTLGNLIATGTSGIVNSSSGWVDVFWSPVSVSTTSTYYLVLDSTDTNLIASASPWDMNDYANGNALYNGTSSNSYDLTFRTFYDDAYSSVPEPASLSLLGIGLVGLGISRRRKHKA